MQSVIAIVGGGRKRGATLAATRQLLDQLQSFGDVQGEIVSLSECNIGLCRGCKVCFQRGEEFCPLKGDRDMLIEKMMAANGVIFASPNYSFQVSAIMKAFLDRLGFVCHRPRFFGKAFTSIVAQGIYGGGKIVKYLNFFGYSVGFRTVKGCCIRALEPMTAKERRRTDRALAKLSTRFHQKMLKPAYPAPTLLELAIFRMSRGSIKCMLGEDSRDYTYYRDKGWFDSDYYYPTRLSPLKKAVGAIVDWTGSRIYKPRDREPPGRPVNAAGASGAAAEEEDT
jgi:multimeric flavodoxin WrbA